MNNVLWSMSLVISLCCGVVEAEELRFYGDPDTATETSNIETPQSSVEFVPDDYSPYRSTKPVEVPLLSAQGLPPVEKGYLPGQAGYWPYASSGYTLFSQYPGYRYPGYYFPPPSGGYTQPFTGFPMGRSLTPGGFPRSW